MENNSKDNGKGLNAKDADEGRKGRGKAKAPHPATR